jgi:hypothetical protein
MKCGRLADSSLFEIDHAAPVPPYQELWCKKAPPSSVLIREYKPQNPLPLSPSPPPPRPDAEKLAKLTKIADRFGALLQNRHTVRQMHRVAKDVSTLK